MVQQLYAEFNATLFGLDEGLATNDCILASAIWRTILGMKEEMADPLILELLVRYTRVQVMFKCFVSFVFFHIKNSPSRFTISL